MLDYVVEGTVNGEVGSCDLCYIGITAKSH